MLENWSG